MSSRSRPRSPIAVPAGEVDAADLVAFAARNRAWMGEGFRPPPTLESWEATLSDRAQLWYAIVERWERDSGVLGMVVFARWAPPPWRSAEIGFAVDSGLAGQGLVQATVPSLLDTHLSSDLGRIEARVHLHNTRAARALRRLGFIFEGNARGCIDSSGWRRTQAQWAIIAADRHAGACRA